MAQLLVKNCFFYMYFILNQSSSTAMNNSSKFFQLFTSGFILLVKIVNCWNGFLLFLNQKIQLAEIPFCFLECLRFIRGLIRSAKALIKVYLRRLILAPVFQIAHNLSTVSLCIKALSVRSYHYIFLKNNSYQFFILLTSSCNEHPRKPNFI